MTDEKPLRVRVAEALGCAPIADDPIGWLCGCRGNYVHADDDGWLLPYGEDSPAGWACTGPLKAKCKIEVSRYDDRFAAMSYVEGWDETASGGNEPEAIANLIIALAEAGKLER